METTQEIKKQVSRIVGANIKNILLSKTSGKTGNKTIWYRVKFRGFEWQYYAIHRDSKNKPIKVVELTKVEGQKIAMKSPIKPKMISGSKETYKEFIRSWLN